MNTQILPADTFVEKHKVRIDNNSHIDHQEHRHGRHTESTLKIVKHLVDALINQLLLSQLVSHEPLEACEGHRTSGKARIRRQKAHIVSQLLQFMAYHFDV